MKKFLFSIFLCCLAITGFAQEHLSFKGIPIEGSVGSFCQQLRAKGFTQVAKNNNLTMFVGDFTGKNATVGVVATDDGKSVFSVVVFFDSSTEWNTLVETYDYYKNIYSRKYGEPAASEENNPSSSDSNFSLMHEVYQGTVIYETIWEVPGGDIELSIEKSTEIHEGMVMIRYRDTKNLETKIQDDLDEI